MELEKKFCHTCCDEVEISLENTTLKENFKGEQYIFQGIESTSQCGHFISDDAIKEYNEKALHDTYRLENHIISLEKIREIPTMYQIGKRPLSHLLQWGELTFTRYYDGDIPSKAYSQLLEEIYNSPEKFLDILERNKSLVSEKTYKKSKESADLRLTELSKITDVLHYIRWSYHDLTPLALHKLLYYCQGFSFAFYGKPLFLEDCTAQEFGPFFPFLEKSTSFCEAKHSFPSKNNLLPHEKKLVDCVILHFACYSGHTLTRFATSEAPYLHVLSQLASDNSCLISKASIQNYFLSIKEKYQMLSILDLKEYPKNLFSQL